MKNLSLKTSKTPKKQLEERAVFGVPRAVRKQA